MRYGAAPHIGRQARDRTAVRTGVPVLIVVEDGAMAALLEYHLRMEGHDADAVEVATAGVRAELKAPQILVIDTDLAGFGLAILCRELRGRQSLRAAAVLALTGRAENPASLAELGLGAKACLAKPFSLAEFSEAVEACLVSRDATPPGK